MSNLFIVAAPSGCGKTSLVESLINNTKNFASLYLIQHESQEPVRLMELIITLFQLLNFKKW